MPAGDPPLTLADLAAIPVSRIKGVGAKKVDALGKAEIHTVLDLLTHYPRRHIDRTREASIAELEPGEEGMVLVRIQSVQSRRTRQRRTMVSAEVTDGSARLGLTFFNQPWRAKQLKEGMEAVVFGKLDIYRGRRQMTNPVVDLIGDRTGRIVPVYPQSERAGLHTWDLAGWIADALAKAAPRGFAEPLGAAIRSRFELVERGRAFFGIHEPATMADVDAARRRLVFDELLRVQLTLVMRKRAIEASETGIEHDVDGELVRRFHAALPFALTGAQHRVIEEIFADLVAPSPMHRLLQGDVGSGKTVVAVSALLAAVQGGHQGALMAPTEVLAEQHHLGVGDLLADLTVPDDRTLLGDRPLRIELLTNRVTGTERTSILDALAAGDVDIVIGTHALIQEGVDFGSLGAVVIDEQHRFGVDQRAALREKGGGETTPDVLVMTATPIPRTAAMTVYGDLDVSVLDELPPGRTPIMTVWKRLDDADGGADGEAEADVWAAVRAEVAAGGQAYVVCPLIDESEKLEVRSAEETFDRLAAGELADLRLGLLHGRVTPGEKQKVMDLFRTGGLDVLVATTVIEVGVDVPNARVMVVLDADRFGIAQLHQLRGRVGRGGGASWCYLVTEGATPDGQRRLEALVASTDGFELAEVDLELRGEGTIMGDRQKGRNDLKLASLRRDKPWVERAREVAFEIVDGDPTLEHHPVLAAELELLLPDDDAAYLLKS